jgi:hypothetical protein
MRVHTNTREKCLLEAEGGAGVMTRVRAPSCSTMILYNVVRYAPALLTLST